MDLSCSHPCYPPWEEPVRITGLPEREGIRDRYSVGRCVFPKVQVALGAGMGVAIVLAKGGYLEVRVEGGKLLYSL